MINAILTVIFVVLILFPFILTFIFLVLSKRSGKAPASVLGLAADITTPFLFLSVYFISRTIFGQGVGFYITLFSILVIILFSIYEKRMVKEFRILRMLRKTWRLFFLLLSSAYVVLLIFGVIVKIIDYTK